VVQNLAWNVLTVDLTVAVVVVECDETLEIHRGDLTHRGLTSRQLEEDLGVESADDRAALLTGTAFAHASPDHPDTLRRKLRRRRGHRRPVVVRIDPGLDIAGRFNPAQPRLASIRRAAEAAVARVVGRVSRLVPEKDPEGFVRAAAEFRGRADVVFRMWGDGPERARLERLRDELGLGAGAGGGGADGAVVELMGATEDVPAALAEMAVFAYPTTGNGRT
jgi:glycosyltransferase involved in cell wall biosynthesis